jgi:hypothetical protein
MPERRFTDEEVGLILREVSEVQDGGRRKGAEGGLTGGWCLIGASRRNH